MFGNRAFSFGSCQVFLKNVVVSLMSKLFFLVAFLRQVTGYCGPILPPTHRGQLGIRAVRRTMLKKTKGSVASLVPRIEEEEWLNEISKSPTIIYISYLYFNTSECFYLQDFVVSSKLFKTFEFEENELN